MSRRHAGASLQSRPRRRGVDRRLRPLRHPQGGVHRPVGRGRPHGRAGRRVLLPRRHSRSPSRSGPRPIRSTSPRPPSPSSTAPAASRPTAPPTTPRPTRRSTSASSSPTPWFGVHHPDRHGPGLRDRATADPARANRVTGAPSTSYDGAPPRQQAAWTAAYEKAVANASVRRRRLARPRRALRTGRRHDRPLTSMARSGGLDGALLEPRAVLRHRLHQAAPLHRRRHLPGEPGRRSTSRATSGG